MTGQEGTHTPDVLRALLDELATALGDDLQILTADWVPCAGDDGPRSFTIQARVRQDPARVAVLDTAYLAPKTVAGWVVKQWPGDRQRAYNLTHPAGSVMSLQLSTVSDGATLSVAGPCVAADSTAGAEAGATSRTAATTD